MADEVKPSLKAQRILVIEDDALIGMLYADLLNEMGHTVCAIKTSEAEAVAAAHHHRPDLMIVDAVLGRGSGVSAVNEILRSGFIPHVFISGDSASVRAIRPDAIVMEKPVRDQDLARAIQRALGGALNH